MTVHLANLKQGLVYILYVYNALYTCKQFTLANMSLVASGYIEYIGELAAHSPFDVSISINEQSFKFLYPV